MSIAIDPATSYAYVASNDQLLKTVGPAPSFPVLATSSLPQKPSDVAVASADHKVYVALPNARLVAVFDTSGNPLGQIQMGRKSKPGFLAVDETARLLYVADQQEKGIAIVDIATDSVLARYAAGVRADGFGFHPALRRIYVSDLQSKTVRAFDPDTGTKLGVVTLSSGVSALFVDTQRDKIYASMPAVPAFAVLDATTLALEATLPVPSSPSSFAVDYANGRLVVSYSGSALVGIWDANSLTELKRASVGPTPAGSAWIPGTSTVLVTNSGSNTVSVVDTLVGASPGVASTLDRPASILVSQAAGRFYVGHYQIDPSDPASLDAPLEIFSANTGEAVGSIPGIGNVFPWGIAENPAASRLYVSRTYAGTVAVVDTVSNSVVTEISVDGMPRAVLFDPSTGYLFVSGMFTSNLVIIDTATNAVIDRIPVGSESAGLALNSGSGLVYVAIESSAELKAVSTATRSVVASAAVGGQPLGVAYSSSTGKVFVANYELGQIEVLDGGTLAPAGSVDFGWPVHTVRADGNRISAVSWEGSSNWVLDAGSLAILQQTTYWAPVDLAIDATGGYLYQTSFDSNSVTRAALP